jgi:hypothetical protein
MIGVKLSSWYSYSNDCLNSLVDLADDRAYFNNNLTLHANSTESWITPVLNFTLIIGTDFA